MDANELERDEYRIKILTLLPWQGLWGGHKLSLALLGL